MHMPRAVALFVAMAFCAGAAFANVGEVYQTDDWTTEKHVPVIDCPDVFVPGEMTEVTIQIGKEISHPNTSDHHINWIRLYFLPEGSPFAYEVASAEFNAHGESTAGPNSSTVYTDHMVTVAFRTEVPGTLFATSFCNIHGMWQSEKTIAVAK